MPRGPHVRIQGEIVLQRQDRVNIDEGQIQSEIGASRSRRVYESRVAVREIQDQNVPPTQESCRPGQDIVEDLRLNFIPVHTFGQMSVAQYFPADRLL